MEKNEQLYFAKTIEYLNTKIKQNKEEKEAVDKALITKTRDLSNNYNEESRGQDLSNSFEVLGQLQDRSEQLNHEGKRLSLQLKNPYFARIDFKPEGKEQNTSVYIGLGTVYGESGKLRVADWRAPICSMYYDYDLEPASFKNGKEKTTGEITLKRQYKIENSQLVSYFDTDLTINDEILQETEKEDEKSTLVPDLEQGWIDVYMGSKKRKLPFFKSWL